MPIEAGTRRADFQRRLRGTNTIGLYVRVLDDFLTRNPAEDALLNSHRWLPDRR